MNSFRPRRGLVGLLALTLGVTGLAVVTTGNAAIAAPHAETPPQVQVGWTDSATPNKAYQANGEVDLPLGRWTDDSGKAHTSRVYATFDLSQFEGKKVYGGTVFAEERSAADCTKRAIEIWRTKAVGATPAWKRAPEPIAKLDEILTPQWCPRASLSFDVGDAVRDAAQRKQRRVTFEIRVPEQYESDPSYGRTLYWYRNVRLTVQYNSMPRVDSAHLYNAGFPCTQLRPYPRFGGFAGTLEALTSDADDWDNSSLRTEFAVWPTADPTARTVVTRNGGNAARVTSVNLPDGTLVDGKSYGWQARASDGADTSAWSRKCFFTYDGTRPPTPTVTSANYPPDRTGQAPVGVPAQFVFAGNGDKDVAGFEYSWSGLAAKGCSASGDVGQLVCPDPLSGPRTVTADTPGGSATVTLNPDRSGPVRLTVRAIDRAGNVSPTTVYETLVPPSAPHLEVLSGTPEWGRDVVFKFTPADGVADVEEYEIVLDDQEPETRQPQEDGAAYYSFTAHNPDMHQLTVRSRSANGFVSEEARWFTYFDPWPGVRSEVHYPRTATRSAG